MSMLVANERALADSPSAEIANSFEALIPNILALAGTAAPHFFAAFRERPTRAPISFLASVHCS
jgi:hypothetical protein